MVKKHTVMAEQWKSTKLNDMMKKIQEMLEKTLRGGKK